MIYKKKNFFIEKVKVQDIAKKYGTPTYCYSYNRLKKNINNFQKNFRSFSPLICFAVKSNTNINLIREIKKFGLGADVVSKGELMMALKAGVRPKKIESKLTNDVLKVFDLKNSVNSKKSYGGTSFDNIKKMIMKYKKQL